MGRRSAGRRRAGGGYHLYALPFVVFDATWLCPFIFPPLVPGPLSRGFLLAEEEWPFAGADALSDLTTIFACISSSFEAFTFFGQNSVTNLNTRRQTQHPHAMMQNHSRP